MTISLIRRVLALAAGFIVAFTTLSTATALACPSMQFVGVRGSEEHSGFGHTVGSVLSAVNAHQPGVGNETVNYWALNVNPWEPKYAHDYMTSVRQGMKNLGDDVAQFQSACAGTPIVLAGYSQGAEVIDHWLSSGANLSDVVGVALFGDPRFDPKNRSPIDQGTYNHSLYGVSNIAQFPHGGIFGGLEHYPADRAAWLRSYCANHDQICNMSSLPALVGCAKSDCAHDHYAEARLGGGTYTEDGANFLLQRARAAMRAAPPTQTNEGGNDESAPEGSGTSPGAPPMPSAPTWAETTGGVTHTWTDYADAGGTEGPSIPSNETVQIACKVTGFRVADGNTWWYRIASPPWNGAYYASADAFYNDGQTSGTLVGTPFVDPNVANC